MVAGIYGRVVLVMSSLTAVWNRLFAVLGRVSMYRLVVLALAALTAIAFIVSLFGVLAPTPWQPLAALAVLAAAGAASRMASRAALRGGFMSDS